MTSIVVHRPARSVRPPDEMPPLPIEPPPALPDAEAGSNMYMLLPALGSVSSLTMMFVYRGSGYMAIGALVLVGTLAASGGMMLSQRGRAGRSRRRQRERYLEYLDQLRERLVVDERIGRARARMLNPPPPALYDLVRDPARRWERRRGDRDFLTVRVGVGELPVRTVHLAEQGSALNPGDPFMLAEAEAVERRFNRSPGLPLLVPLDRAGNVSIVGAREPVLRAAHALLAQVVTAHAPDDVAVAVAHQQRHSADWACLKWLPHALHRRRRDGQVPARRVAPSPAELGPLLDDEIGLRASHAAQAHRSLGERHGIGLLHRLLVVHDTYGAVASPLAVTLPDHVSSPADLGVTVLHLVADQLHEPDDVAVRLTVNGDAVTVEDLRGGGRRVSNGQLDQMSPALIEGVSRMLAPLRLSADSVDDAPHSAAVATTTLLGIDDPAHMDIDRLMSDRGERGFLRVPIGVDDQGQPVLLDLKEAAQLGMGPHGLCVGATGSGKSELLRMLVLALAATHPPADLAMTLIDYKGGATFTPFEGLPQVAGVITNLEDDAGLIERVYASLEGEVRRRQQVLRDVGGVADIADYRALRAVRGDLPPLPHLLVIIDEFGELLTYRPDFVELLLTIGRIGRSIGVHLLLSSQRMEGGKLKGLEAYLSYRLGLRTFSEAESRTVLDTPDAFALPPLPGFGYLKVDTTVYQLFKAGYVSGPFRDAEEPEPIDPVPDAPAVRPYLQYNLPASVATTDEEALPERSIGRTLLSVIVDQLTAAAKPVHRIWLPVLPGAFTLDGLADAPVQDGARGLQFRHRPPAMRAPLGLLDDPARQRQQVWAVDLGAAGGHVAVIGAPQSGKTMLLRTLVAGLALSHTPREVAVYGIDLMGAGLLPLSGFPHVGGVAGRTDRELIRRTVEEIRGMLDQRERLFRDRGIDSVERLRAWHRAGELPELPTADVVFLIDGVAALRGDFEELEGPIGDLLARGGGYGVHVVAAMLRANDIRMSWQSTFGSRIELRLGDAADSNIGRRLAETIRTDQPGRALTGDKLFAQVALPRIDGRAEDAGLVQAIEELAGTSRALWPGETAPPIRILPRHLPAAALPDPAIEPTQVPIGVDETQLRPVTVDLFDTAGHLMVLGDERCGKTNLLRLVADGIRARYTADQVTFAVMAPRRGLRDVLPEAYVGGYAQTSANCFALAAGVAKELAKRAPGGAGDEWTPSGFSGPRVVVLIDDYDVFGSTEPHPLEPLLPFLPGARDIGLSVVLSRRMAGASRALYEPFLLTLREGGTSGLVMSGDRGEGQIFPGVYPSAQPAGRGHWVHPGEPVRLVQTAMAAST